MSNPWDKQPGETPKAFVAFSAYLAMEPKKRSVLAAYLSTLEEAEKGRKGQIKSPPTSWRDWAFDHDWKARAAAYDTYNDRQKRRDMERVHAQEVQRFRSQLRKDTDNLLKIARIAMTKAAEGLQTVDMAGAKPHTVATMLTAASNAMKVGNETHFTALGLDEVVELLTEEQPVVGARPNEDEEE